MQEHTTAAASAKAANTAATIVVRGVTLKMALDTSGGVVCLHQQKQQANNSKPERFTSSESLDMVHRLRAASDAVLVGVGTALADDPSLLVRRNVAVGGAANNKRQPLRVVIDPSLKLLHSTYSNYQLLTDGYPLVIYHSQEAVEELDDKCSSAVQLVYLKPESSSSSSSRLSVMQIVDDLKQRFGVQHIMVEGGPATARAFLEANCVDRCILVKAPNVTFREPLPSGITDAVLQQQASLVRLGTIDSGGDAMECWSRPGVPWPAAELTDWP